MICGADSAGVEFPDAGMGMCCYGAAIYGPGRCTCWEPVFDMEQADPAEELSVTTRTAMCEDCAYRPDSYERADKSEEEHLMTLPLSRATVFWCHQGMRAPSSWRHGPSGVEIPAARDRDYRPLMVELDGQKVPLRADGTPAQVCAGWAARRRRSEKVKPT